MFNIAESVFIDTRTEGNKIIYSGDTLKCREVGNIIIRIVALSGKNNTDFDVILCDVGVVNHAARSKRKAKHGNKNKWRDWNLVIRKCSRERWGIRGGNGNRPSASGSAMDDLQQLHQMYASEESL